MAFPEKMYLTKGSPVDFVCERYFFGGDNVTECKKVYDDGDIAVYECDGWFHAFSPAGFIGEGASVDEAKKGD